LRADSRRVLRKMETEWRRRTKRDRRQCRQRLPKAERFRAAGAGPNGRCGRNACGPHPTRVTGGAAARSV
jgi:hypothetical protein